MNTLTRDMAKSVQMHDTMPYILVRDHRELDMGVLPTETFLGKLTMQAVYEYHDKPVLFTCHNAVQTHYLAVLLDEIDQVMIWLYVALSAKRLALVEQGSITLQNAFKQAEDDIVYEITCFQCGFPTQIRILPTHALPAHHLPANHERLQAI